MLFNSARLMILQRSNIRSMLASKQITSLNFRYLASSQLTHLNFPQNSNVYRKEKTGLLNRRDVHVDYRNYLQSKSFHSHSILYLNNSNFAGQKVNRNSDVKSTLNDEKNEDPKSVDTQTESTKNANDEKPLTLYAKFKKMAKEYWYVLIPVHAFTSVFWIGGFYYASLNGVDIVGILENLHMSETIISKLRDSSLGHWAIAYLCYKIASPARYTVTLAGTTYTINVLSNRGIIKPMPTRGELVQMYKDKKDEVNQKIEDKKQDFQHTKENLQQKVTDKKDELYQKLEDTKQDIQLKIEEKKQDIQQKVADKKQEIEEKLKRSN
ncbi:uncharacterized protein C18orf19 homolog A [Chironomus tepperi]|uniref:uncharacterized protein C18orf19 homolog A n=1 Tax=Chironomus tepperi TaxID=113505 RepID=UPI00391F3440